MQLIEADLEKTWPEALLRELDASRESLAAFQIERARIDRAAYDDVVLRVYRHQNPHESTWDTAPSSATHATASGFLLGFHATRLMDHEMEEIRTYGLRLCSIELLQHRLAAAQSVRRLTAIQVEKLLARHQAVEANRIGRTAFVFTRGQLKSDSDFGRLFRSWGGEALYNSHENDDETGPILASLGIPCIVVAAVKVADVEPRFKIGHRLIDVWCAHRNIRTELGEQFGGVVRAPTPAKNIMRIVKFGDPEFVELTNHNKWRRPLS
jgi:hypothetical protein